MLFLIRTLALAAITVLPITSQAATLESSVFMRTSCGSGIVDVSGSGTIFETLGESGDNCSTFSQAYAGGGAVGISGDLNVLPFPGGQILETDFSANIVMRNIELSAADGFTIEVLEDIYGTSISVGLNASLEGFVFASLANNGVISSRNTYAGLRAVAEISGFADRIPQKDTREIRAESVASNIGSPPPTGGIVVADGLLRPTIMASLGSPLTVIFRLQGNLDTALYGDSQGSTQIEALESLSFSKTGPAFILPTGFTVNAPELNIFDNQWIDPRATGPSPIPLPAGLPLLLAGLGILGVLRRHK